MKETAGTYRAEELLEKILILTTVNSTLLHLLLSVEAGEQVSPEQIRQLAHGVRAVRDSVQQAFSTPKGRRKGQPASSFVSDTVKVILNRMGRMEEALGKLAGRLEEQQAVAAAAGEVAGKVAEAGDEGVAEEPAEAALDLAGLAGKPFQRHLSVHDPNRNLQAIQQLLERYSTHCHLLLPTYWFEACRELHRYSEPKEVIAEVTRLAGKAFYNLVRRLLSEAPSAGLLQALYRSRGPEAELTHSEQDRIIGAARLFYDHLAMALKSGSVDDAISEANSSLRNFDWGGLDIEKRVVGVFHRSATELRDQAKSKTLNAQQRIISAELSRYICELTASLHQLPRLRRLLAEMKP